MKKIIIHLCAYVGSDSRFYDLDDDYEVIIVDEKIGVQNYEPPENVWGVFANPECTGLTTIHGFDKQPLKYDSMFLVNHCIRIIKKCNPKWWVMENPALGKLKDIIGKPAAVYQPWEYGSPWTKKTALWGNFIMPEKKYTNWEDVPKNEYLYIRPNRKKPSLAYLHVSSLKYIPEFDFAANKIKTDSCLRSMCSQGFAKAFYEVNK